jgi:hypothetical protein
MWILLFSLIVVKIYVIAYLTIRPLSTQRPIYDYVLGPTPDALDILCVSIISFIGGWVLHDPEEIFFGWVATILTTLILGVAFVSYYIWGPLGWGAVLSYAAFDWEQAVYFAIWNVVRIMFPLLIAASLISVVLGAYVRTWTKPSLS